MKTIEEYRAAEATMKAEWSAIELRKAELRNLMAANSRDWAAEHCHIKVGDVVEIPATSRGFRDRNAGKKAEVVRTSAHRYGGFAISGKLLKKDGTAGERIANWEID